MGRLVAPVSAKIFSGVVRLMVTFYKLIGDALGEELYALAGEELISDRRDCVKGVRCGGAQKGR